MKDRMRRFLSQADRHKIESRVREAESHTRGEIVVMVVPESCHYPMAALLGGTVFSLPAAIALTQVSGRLFWVGPDDLWVFLTALIPLFVVFHEAVKRIPALKRCFVRAKEMEEEVREAAYVQFFRKGLYRTHEETGVLIYVSVFEHGVWVLGDRGVNAAIPEAHWNAVVAGIVQAIKEGRPADGICRAVEEVGRILREKFPGSPDDRDELENLMVEEGPHG
jgi:putative membrane protein